MESINTERGRRDPRGEHSDMTACKCAPEDRLTFCCLVCGKVHLIDPSWFFIVGSVVLFAWNLYSWMTL